MFHGNMTRRALAIARVLHARTPFRDRRWALGTFPRAWA